MTPHAGLLSSVLAETTDPDVQKSLIESALPIAGLFVLVLFAAVLLLWRSMNRQMKKIDPELPSDRDDEEQAADRRLTQEALERGEESDDAASS